ADRSRDSRAAIGQSVLRFSGALSVGERIPVELLETLPLPDDPVLASWASALNAAGHFAYLLDASWRYVFVTDETRLTWGDTGGVTAVPVGSHYFSAKAFRFRTEIVGAHPDPEGRRAWFSRVGPFVLATTPGGRGALRPMVDPELADLVDELELDSV